jgi:ABC-type Zn uptake system ZnuABC Zn-binding protein ZnuA
MDRRKLVRNVVGATIAGAVLPLMALGCGNRMASTARSDGHGPKVVVSFAPLYCFAANVAGDDATVKNVMTTTGPHDFIPTDAEVRLVTNADILFIVGLGLDERQAELMKSGSGNTKLKVVELGERLDPKTLRDGFADGDGHGDGHKHEKDPHVWLSPDLAAGMANVIRDELKAADPAHAAGYDARAAAYVARLDRLKADGLARLKDKKDRRIVTFHDSMGYFADAFKLDVRGVLTQKPGQEPDDKQMSKLISICSDKTNPTRVIVVEPQYSNSNSGETLRKELAAKGVPDPKLVEFNTLETVRPDDLTPDWYEKEMGKNLAALAADLK